ncbi:uncharacterized protein BXZ73DRAFT_111982 [Epithele typhae]|uniref:uncharacterized protein n=1 Tax=Epithele typhae TaxID=378194 RepID=UPI0020080F12|nr:uncharacterized protein BXZ73DRAFT_111982 [Epithele typhae]KAH9892218.1 hypothetical protein BXZ73DRAFT_111982 [Epithele typhae]
MEASGLSPLLVATLGFLGTVGQHSLDVYPLMGSRIFHLLSSLGTVGSSSPSWRTKAGSAKNQADLDSSGKYRHIETKFSGSAQAPCGDRPCLPILALRVLYSVLSAFSPSPFAFSASDPPQRIPNPYFASSSLAKFNATAGEWGVYLALSVLPRDEKDYSRAPLGTGVGWARTWGWCRRAAVHGVRGRATRERERERYKYAPSNGFAPV